MSAPTLGLPRLKDFIFTEKLGSGTYATVFKAYKKDGRREVFAIKCVDKTSLNKTSTDNLLTEIEVLKGLRHEHIVELKDFLWDDRYIYLVMEYCSGGDLHKFIQTRRKLPEHVVRRFLQQLAQALQYMRSKNVAHMDLKPQNLLLSSSDHPRIKIADFGFAHYLMESTSVDHIRGSPLYMAPEIITRRHYDPRADLWSLGVILYECLFGKAPFASTTFQELGEKIRDSKPVEIPFGADVSEMCRDLLLRLLQRDPKQRISFEEFFEHPFVDLEHIPSADCLNKAIALVKEAVEQDSAGHLAEAAQLYCSALDYFVPAIAFETDPSRKHKLRGKVNEYIARAEEIKSSLKPTQPLVHRCVSVNRLIELEKLSADSDEIMAAIQIISVAEFKEEHDQYEGAYEKYELALEGLIKVLEDEPNGRRKDLLRQQMSVWMSRAEKIKSYVALRKLRSQEIREKEEREQEEITKKMNCAIQ